MPSDRSLTNKNEAIVHVFSQRMTEWEIKFFETRASTVSGSKLNINQWLDEMELTWNGGMTQANLLSGAEASKLVRNVADLGFDFEAYLEVYGRQVRLLSQKDLTEATVLRNGLARNLGDGQWQEVYKEFDDFTKSHLGLSLQQQQKAFMNTAVWRDNIAFIDRIGRKWTPKAYSEMWCRTRNSEIADEVLVDDMDEVGLDIVRITDHNTTTPICIQFEGKYFSMFGRTPGLPKLRIRTPFHPSCKHREMPISNQEERKPMIEENQKKNKTIKSENSKMTSAQKKSIKTQKDWYDTHRGDKKEPVPAEALAQRKPRGT